MKKLYLFIMFAVLASLGFANAATVTDVLTAKLFTATGSSYTDFSNVTVTSSAVYAGNSAKSDAGAIQLRSKKNNSGIVTTASAGTVRKITVVWDDATASGRTIDVYGKSTAYSSDTDLFGSADVQGVLIGSIAKGKSELVVEGDYQFIGIRSNFGAIYVTSISVEWEAGSTPAKLKAPVISGVENGVEYKSAKVAISYPAGATSMTWAVTKDGAAWKGGDATSAVSVDVTEDGSYEVSASATDGATTKTAENVTFTIKAPTVPTVGYEAMDVANVKEGNYIIVGENDGKFYMMKNETYSVNYVAATETTLNGTESFSSANLFTIKKQGEGYTIQSADGKYVTVEKSTNGTKTFYNLRVGKDASDAVWKFADATGGKVQATYGEFTNFMSFIWYSKVEPGVPEFSTGYQDSHIRPAFYYVGDVTPVEPEAVKVASIAEFYTKGLADSGPEYEFTCPLTSTYQSGKNLYVTDGTDGMLIYGQPDKVCVNGFVLAPGVKGKFSNFNGSYQLTDAVLTEITDNGKGVAPEEMTIAGITAEKQNRYVVIRNAMLDTEDGVTTLFDDTGTIVAFDKGFIAFPADESKIYDVTAMTAYFKGQVQVYPVNFTEIPKDVVQEPGIGISGYPLNPDSDEHIYYGEVEVIVMKSDDVASIHAVVTKDGVEVDNVTATEEWRKTYSEVGKYLISATATNGSLTSAPIEAEFEIVPEPVITAPTFSLAEGTYTGTQIVTIEGYRGSMIVGTCNDDDVYDYSPCDVTLAAPATGEITYVLTVHSELGEKQGEESTATYVIKAGEPAAEGAFHLVTSAEMLKEGAKVILVSETNAMSTVQNVKNAAKQYRQSTTVVVDGNVVPSVGTDVAVFTVGKDGDNYTFYNAATKTETGAAMPGYLCAVSNEKNALGVESTLSDNGKWSVEFAGSTVKMLAQGEFTRNLLQFNYNGFRCYKPSTTTIDTKLSIYCQVESGVDDATADMVKIIGEEGAIRVVAESADVTVYTMTGQTVAVAAVDGEATICLAAGFYIVRVGGTTVKVVVK